MRKARRPPISGAFSLASVLHFYSGKPLQIHSGVDNGSPCPPVASYSREFLARAADEVALLPPGSAAEQNGGNSANGCEEPNKLQRIRREQAADDPDHRSPRRRSSIRAQIM